MRAGRGRRGKLTCSRRLRDWFRLAETLGRSVAEAKATVSEREFSHWQAMFAREPSARERADWWGAHLLAAAHNPYRKSGSSPLDPADLIPDPWGERAAAGKTTGRRGWLSGDSLVAGLKGFFGGG